jgi:hypothetical protein
MKNLLIELEEKGLQWFCQVNGMDRTNLLRRASILKLEGKDPMGRRRTRWFSQIFEDVKKRIKNRK